MRVDAPHRRDRDLDDALWRRACGEYLEIPGLRLTVAQAARLWDVPPAVCQRLLDGLVESAFLRRRGGDYVRADSTRTCA